MTKIFCKSCGFPNEDGSEFCANCGKNLPESSKQEPIVVTPTPTPITEEIKITPTTKQVPKSIASKTSTEMPSKLVPFLGDSIEIGETLSRPQSIGSGALNADSEFYFGFQQRNHLKIDIEEEFTEKRTMDGLLTISTPNIKKESENKKKLLDLYVNTPELFESQVENYPLKQYSGSQQIDYGQVIISAPTIEFEDQIGNVLPITSKDASYNDALEKKVSGIQSPINIDWEKIESIFEKSPIIKHHLYKLGDDFKWDHPISLKIEIEHPINSILKNYDIYDGANWRILKNVQNLQKELKAGNETGFEAEILDKYMNVFGIGSSVVDSSRLATVRIQVSNITNQQIFNSNLMGANMKLQFFNIHKELVQPSALKIPKNEGEFLLKQNHIYWDLPDPFVPGPQNSKIYEFKLDWEILLNIEKISISIGGEFQSNPNILKDYIYAAPTGFPIGRTIIMVKNKPTTISFWNPGTFSSEERPVYLPTKKLLSNKGRFMKSKPVFLQQVNISVSNLEKDPRKYGDILDNANDYINKLLANIKKISRGRDVKEKKEGGNK